MKKILIIEDEKLFLEAIETTFQIEKFNVFTATNGIDGLRIARIEMPDIILLDIVLPGIDGLQILEELKKNEKTKHIKVIILTNFPDSEKIEKAVVSGGHDYLVKADWQIQDIVKKVKEKLGI